MIKKYYLIGYIIIAILISAGLLWQGLRGQSVRFTGEDLSANEEMTTFYTPGMLLHEGNIRVKVFYASDARIRMDFYGNANDNYIDNLEPTLYGTTFERDYFLSKDSQGSKLRFEIPDGSILYISEIEISSDKLLYNDGIILAFISITFFASLYFFLKRKGYAMPDREGVISFCVMALAVALAYLPHAGGKLYDGNDLGGQLIRLEGVKDGILGNQFPVILFPRTLGEYGELGAMYPYLFLIIPALLRILNMSILAVFDLMVISICAAVVWVMYYSMRTFGVSRMISALSAAAYLITPAFIHGETDNGAVMGAGFAYIFLPLIFAGLYHVLTGRTEKWPMLTIGFTGVLQSHLVTTLMMLVYAVFAAAFITIREVVKKRFNIRNYLYVLKAGLWCVPINIWWLAIFFYYYFNGNLFVEALGTTFTGLDLSSFMALEATRSSLLFIGLTVVVLILLKFFKTGIRKDMIFVSCMMLALSIMILFSVTVLCPWESLRTLAAVRFFTNTMQFPTRFYVVISACATMAFGIALDMLCEGSGKGRSVIIPMMILLVFISAFFLDYGFVKAYLSPDNLFCTRIMGDVSPFKQREYLPDGTEDEYYLGNYVEVSDEENVNIDDYEKREDKVSFRYTVKGDINEAYVELPMFYYPGYEIKLDDGSKLAGTTGSMNHMRIYLPPEHSGRTVNIGFKVSPVFCILTVLSLLSFLLFVLRASKEKERFRA